MCSLECENVGKIQISMQKVLIEAVLLYDYSKTVWKSNLRHYFELDLTSLDFRGLKAPANVPPDWFDSISEQIKAI